MKISLTNYKVRLSQSRKIHYSDHVVDHSFFDTELHKRVDDFRYTLGDFVECERLAENDIDVSQPAISHIEDELNKYQAEYVST